MEYGKSAISELDHRMIDKIINYVEPQNVLEFGPGTSTVVFARHNIFVNSYEHDVQYLQKAKDLVSQFPRVRIDLRDRESIHNVSYAMAFVDGPPGSDTLSRWCALEQAMKMTDLILLHDSKRDGERQSIEKMLELGWKCFDIDTEVGLALLYKGKYENTHWHSIVQQ